ncbi:protein BLISTER [Lactuca sativa]|uniref:BLISTER n=1 Tax=Lactuca sativa TaxID=4236 RepID=A0A9R1VCI1_LACSA|nr:protein BLISTER [Lactuca sativa]KAJ0203806.1 hypothetical protein LSAT_V11C500282710 [Lactuca sativa]
MASDQMLPNSSVSSKKQQQLEAGKRRLEEFRKKKAAAKKAASSNSVNGDLHEVKPSVADATSDLSSEHVGNNEKKTKDIHVTESHSMHPTNENPINTFNKPSANPVKTYSTDKKLDHPHPEEDINHSSLNHYSNTRFEDALRNPYTTAQASVNKSSPEIPSSSNNSIHTVQQANGSTYRDSLFEVVKSLQYPPVSDSVTESSSESVSTTFRYDAVASTGLPSRRSRPSFLDSILPNEETDKAINPFSSKVHPVDAPPVAQSFINPNPSSVANVVVGDSFMERNSNFNSAKQNEDFAALEQHIEDLTQEKFSLQRALEASRVLAESLATENSALTDSYNQQGGVVNQLKLDMERLQEEIKAQLVELEAMRIEYGNAQLECSAADERSKLLASEVIGLEEKALRLRSNELKLERQLENLEAEMSSQKRRISSLEKDRQDLQFTIEALQEEKKVLQSKLRKAPVITNSVDIKKPPTNNRKEASTSTDDLDESEEDNTTAATSNLSVLVGTHGESDASSHLGFEVSSSSIPPDQIKMIQNISTLISELALEKEELVQALSTESSRSSKLKDLNKELSQKLEVQTQRLELLTSQSMSMVGAGDANNNNNNNNIPPRKPTSRTVVDHTPYADEGDEVVERVLGWIMKLFPGGPSKRQTKHL